MQKAAAAAVAERGFYAFVTLEKDGKRNGLKWEIVEGKLGLGFG